MYNCSLLFKKSKLKNMNSLNSPIISNLLFYLEENFTNSSYLKIEPWMSEN